MATDGALLLRSDEGSELEGRVSEGGASFISQEGNLAHPGELVDGFVGQDIGLWRAAEKRSEGR